MYYLLAQAFFFLDSTSVAFVGSVHQTLKKLLRVRIYYYYNCHFCVLFVPSMISYIYVGVSLRSSYRQPSTNAHKLTTVTNNLLRESLVAAAIAILPYY